MQFKKEEDLPQDDNCTNLIDLAWKVYTEKHPYGGGVCCHFSSGVYRNLYGKPGGLEQQYSRIADSDVRIVMLALLKVLREEHRSDPDISKIIDMIFFEINRIGLDSKVFIFVNKDERECTSEYSSDFFKKGNTDSKKVEDITQKEFLNKLIKQSKKETTKTVNLKPVKENTDDEKGEEVMQAELPNKSIEHDSKQDPHEGGLGDKIHTNNQDRPIGTLNCDFFDTIAREIESKTPFFAIRTQICSKSSFYNASAHDCVICFQRLRLGSYNCTIYDSFPRYDDGKVVENYILMMLNGALNERKVSTEINSLTYDKDLPIQWDALCALHAAINLLDAYLSAAGLYSYINLLNFDLNKGECRDKLLKKSIACCYKNESPNELILFFREKILKETRKKELRPYGRQLIRSHWFDEISIISTYLQENEDEKNEQLHTLRRSAILVLSALRSAGLSISDLSEELRTYNGFSAYMKIFLQQDLGELKLDNVSVLECAASLINSKTKGRYKFNLNKKNSKLLDATWHNFYTDSSDFMVLEECLRDMLYKPVDLRKAHNVSCGIFIFLSVFFFGYALLKLAFMGSLALIGGGMALPIAMLSISVFILLLRYPSEPVRAFSLYALLVATVALVIYFLNISTLVAALSTGFPPVLILLSLVLLIMGVLLVIASIVRVLIEQNFKKKYSIPASSPTITSTQAEKKLTSSLAITSMHTNHHIIIEEEDTMVGNFPEKPL